MFVTILRRIFSGLAAILLASLLTFYILEASPGDVVNTLLGDEATMKQQEELRAELKLDKPLHLRYLDFLVNLARGDLGVSAVNGRPVLELIGQRFINTLWLAISSITLAFVAGSCLGVWSALRHKRRSDLVVLILTAFFLAVPTFGYAIFFTEVFAVQLGWLPVVGGGSVKHFILPCFSLAIPSMAVITRIVRARVIEELRKPYVTTARAKGVVETVVWRKHVFCNALIPAITLVGVQFGHLLGGAFIVETIFAWPGLGRLTVQAVFDQDYPVVLGAVVLSAIIFQLCNALVDIAHSQLDPHIRSGGSGWNP